VGLYLIQNGPMQTTAALAKVSTGTAVKTMLQFAPLVVAEIVEWGISFDGSAAATPIEVELIETGTVAATVTACVAADVTKVRPVLDATAVGTVMTLSTAGTGYTASAEGSIVAVRNLDAPQLIAPTNQFVKQFPLGNEPIVQIGDFARIRVTAPAAVNAYCYMIVRI
jgi:hypothetical protein